MLLLTQFQSIPTTFPTEKIGKEKLRYISMQYMAPAMLDFILFQRDF